METILIVDDNPANIGLLFDCLSHAGYKTLVAQDGKSAVSMASRLGPDLILLDVIMPEMDGFDTCTALKQDIATAEIPVFFMTALNDTESKVRGFECGAVDFISKPFQQEEVLARIQAHLTIQKQKKSLLLSNHIKEKVISVVAHDLRSPFTAIFAYLQMLSQNYDRYDDNRRKDYIEKLRGANQNLFSLVESLLSWITTGEGRMEYAPEKVLLRDVAVSAVEVTQALADKKRIDLTMEIPEKLSAFTDENMLAAVVRNLLTNAFKFTPPEGRVRLTAEQEKSRVVLEVSDTGVGMTVHQVELVNRGNKIHSTQGTDAEVGTGMGLVVCQEFIRLMGGSLTIKSEPDRGSTFRVSLPGTEN